MPRFLEDRLKAEAASRGMTGKAADRYTYGAMNNMGAMKGNVETTLGATMEAKHEAKVGVPRAKSAMPKMREVGAHSTHIPTVGKVSESDLGHGPFRFKKY